VLGIPTNGVYGEPILQLQAVDGRRAWALTQSDPCDAIGCPADLRRTTDGGRTWTTLLHGTIDAMRFASAYRGWVAVEDSRGVDVRTTSDGGTTWGHDFRPGAAGFGLLDAASTQRAWLLTRDGGYCTSSNCSKYGLFRTDDGGVSWSMLGNPKDSASPDCSFGHLGGPLFASPTRGWMTLNLGAGGASGPGGLFSTEDGGLTWRCNAALQNTTMVSAGDPLHVWVASENRSTQATTLYASDDGGQTWHAVALPVPA
jgi:photosystem II stability/assembly factor-like uncharacterized protein